jgi:uncharacterized YigZ family protein
MAHRISSAVESELLIKKSRFLGCVQPVPDRASAQAIVARLKVQHPGAAHVCWALMAGGHSAAVDDGEPSGTAGKPMLEVLRHQGLEGVLATVVRYYGGIQLGAGGLVRAYTDCVAQALKSATKVPIVKLTTLHCAVPYALEGMLRREIEALGGALLRVQHGAEVEVTFSMAATAADTLVAHLNEAGQGRIAWQDRNAP